MQSMIDIYHQLLQPAITLGWPITYMELIILVFNVFGVYLAAKNNVLTAPVCLVAITAYMLTCYSLNFYSEFFLQIYFFATNIWLLFAWTSKKDGKPTEVHYMGWLDYLAVLGLWIAGTYMLGSNIDALFAGVTTGIMGIISLFTGEVYTYIHEPASYPFIDAFTTVGQVIAMVLMVRRVIENWWMWIVIDLVSIPMFILKGGYGVSLMFVLFLIPAIKGAIEWRNIEKQQAA